jgi:hypothetical protein
MQAKFRTVVENSVDDGVYRMSKSFYVGVAPSENERGFGLVWTSKRAADWAGEQLSPARFGSVRFGEAVQETERVRCSAEKRSDQVVAVTVILARACAH